VPGPDLGRRSTFADVGATVADHFGVPVRTPGTSFLPPLRSGTEEAP
jgi:phosphopentomutase